MADFLSAKSEAPSTFFFFVLFQEQQPGIRGDLSDSSASLSEKAASEVSWLSSSFIIFAFVVNITDKCVDLRCRKKEDFSAESSANLPSFPKRRYPSRRAMQNIVFAQFQMDFVSPQGSCRCSPRCYQVCYKVTSLLFLLVGSRRALWWSLGQHRQPDGQQGELLCVLFVNCWIFACFYSLYLP